MATLEQFSSSQPEDPLNDYNWSVGKHINCLSDPNRATRKRGLEGLKKELFLRPDAPSKESLFQLLNQHCQHIVKLFSDPVEKCRELSIALFADYLSRCDSPLSILPTVVPAMVLRLGQQEITEPSEEIRLQLVSLLTDIVRKSERGNAVYLDDYIKILQRTIVDPYPEVKKQSCSCSSILAKIVPDVFHLQSESLIKPLVLSITHQHSRVRVAVVNAIGQVLLYGNNKCFDDVISHLAQRFFDQAPAVREAVTQVIGMWLLELPDRYSFFHKLIPLMLTSLTDELPSIQDQASSLWHDVGILYSRENENDLKEKGDFAAPTPRDYPEGIERPNIGCRELVYRHQSKILPGLSRDILDWVVETRKKSASLLYCLIINAESNVTQHMQLIIDTSYKASIDDEPYVVNYIEKSMQLLGYFVLPEVWMPIVIPTLEKQQHFGSILSLANLIRGSTRTRIEEHLPSICQSVSLMDVCTTRQLNSQEKLLDLVSAVIDKYMDGVLEQQPSISYKLFYILLSLMSVAQSDNVIVRANGCLDKLAIIQDMSREDLFKWHTAELLDSFGQTYVMWTNHSVERLIFDTLLVSCGSVIGDMLDRIVPMLKANLDPEKDPEVRLKLFSLVAKLVQNKHENLKKSSSFEEFVVSLVRDMIIPNCIWKAGRTASVIRTTAVSCLWCILKNRMISSQNLLTVLEDLVTQLLSLLEDDSLDTRLVSCRVLMHMFSIMGKDMEQHRLYNVYPKLLKRLDDSNDNVRIAMTKTFLAYFDCFGSYDAKSYRAHLEEVTRGLLLHLDDPNPEIQAAVQDVLQKIANIQPGMLKFEVEQVVQKHRTPKYCNSLIRYCERLNLDGQGDS